MQKTTWVNGWEVERRVEYRARAREGASRCCWLKRRMRGGGFDGGEVVDGVVAGEEVCCCDEEVEEEEANHDAASFILSSVCPESMCHAITFSRRISHRPGQWTRSRPWMNSGGRVVEDEGFGIGGGLGRDWR